MIRGRIQSNWIAHSKKQGNTQRGHLALISEVCKHLKVYLNLLFFWPLMHSNKYTCFQYFLDPYFICCEWKFYGEKNISLLRCICLNMIAKVLQRKPYEENKSWVDCICLNMIAKVLQRKLYEEKHIMVRLYLSQYDCEILQTILYAEKTYQG